MKLTRILLSACLISTIAIPTAEARSLLQKPMYYINANTNKVGQSMFWIIYLGAPECSVSRKYPGEEMQKFDVSIGLHFMSSGYIEGNGYCQKGPISCSPTMFIKTDGSERELSIDSIDCIYDFGSKVRTTSGAAGDFEIDIEGQKVPADRMIMTEYKMIGVGADRELQKTGDDISLSAIAFSKDGVAWATRAMTTEAKADTAKPDTVKAARQQ